MGEWSGGVMWISRREYRQLLEAAAQLIVVKTANKGLSDTLAYFQSAYETEKKRADNAVDELLVTKGTPPITPTPPHKPSVDDLWEEDEEEVKKIMERRAA